MSSLTLGFLLLDVVVLWLLPRRWAALPVLAGACYLPLAAGIQIGPFHFDAVRLLIAAALLRMLLRGEGLSGSMNALDRVMLWWAAVALGVSFFYADVGATLVNRLGLVYMACGSYFVLRAFCPSIEAVPGLCRITAVLLVPLAAAMLYEKLTGHNLFAVFGGVAEWSAVRDGMVRAQGPFAHPILAGSVGATCLPLMAALWRGSRKTAAIGALACLTMVFSSGSSGPIMSAGFAIAALAMWRWRGHMRLLRWSALLGYIALDLVMKAPAYYLLTRIDLTGSSTSWHRAALIQSAIAHWSEWWLAGTAYTRHWMPYGVAWSGAQSDITNYYLRMGVDGGLPLLLLFIAVLAKGFSLVGHSVRESPVAPFVMWALGASLFAHAATFVSVSYFDQSVVFLYLTLAAIGSGATGRALSPVGADTAQKWQTHEFG